MECGSGTRRRPKRTGLWRGKHAECGKKDDGEVWKAEFGMRPPASPSCRRYYEPEAGGAIVAYAPEGRRERMKLGR